MKVRRVDLWPDDWLGGIVGLSLEARGVYLTACLLIYSHGGPIDCADLRDMCPKRSRKFGLALAELIERQKLVPLDGDKLDQRRCEVEIERARARIRSAQGAANERWHPSPHDGSDAVPSHFRDSSSAVPAQLTEPTSNDFNNMQKNPHMPAKRRSQETKQEFNINNNTLGCAWAHAREAPPEPTDEDKAHVDRLVADMLDVLKLPPSGLRNGVHSADAYREAIAATKRDQWLNNLSLFVGEAFDGMPERMAAWEAIEQTRTAGSRAATAPDVRRAVDELSRLREKSIAYAEAAE